MLSSRWLRSMSFIKLSSRWSAFILKTSVVAKKFPLWLLRRQTGLGCAKAATLGASPLDDLNGVVSRQFRPRVEQNILTRWHFPIFDHRRDCSERPPLFGCAETIPARKIEVLPGMLHVVLDK